MRELQNFIERAVILTRGRVLEAPLAELTLTNLHRASSETTPGSVSPREREEIVRIVRETISGMKNEDSKNAAREYDERQRDEILRSLGETKGRVGGPEGAAARLGINRTTLLARMKKLGIDPREFSCPAM